MSTAHSVTLPAHSDAPEHFTQDILQNDLSLAPPAATSDAEVDSCASTDDSVDDLPEVDMIEDFALPRPFTHIQARTNGMV